MAVQLAPLWFVSLQMVSPESGWALRWTHNPSNAGALLAAALTTDGGRTWTDLTPPQARPQLSPTGTAGTLYGLDAEHAWFAVSRTRQGRPPRTTVFATADGGRTWSSSTPFASLGDPEHLDFVDPSHGWLLADVGAEMGNDAVAIFATADGGRSWSLASKTAGPEALEKPTVAGPAPGELPLYGNKTGLKFVSPTTGWVTTANVGGPPNLYVTHDSGRTWAAQSLPIPAGAQFTAGSEAPPPEFFGSTGFLSLWGLARPLLLLSHDGGATWTGGRLPARAGRFPRAQFVDARHGFLIEGGPSGSLGAHLYCTSDGGVSWSEVRTNPRFSRLGTSFDFVTPQVGFAWVLGADVLHAAPPLYETSDGGQTWNRIIPQVRLR